MGLKEISLHEALTLKYDPRLPIKEYCHYIEAKSGVITICDEPFIASKIFDYFYVRDYEDSLEEGK